MTILILMSVFAGALTTVTGAGGGLLLLLVLSALWEPARALAVTAPALLLGNAHRAITLRKAADYDAAKAFALGAFPAGLLGGLLAGVIPGGVVHGLLVGLTLASLLRAVLKVRVHIPAAALLGSGAGIGLLTGATGGAGMLVSPLLLSRGLVRERYIATGACCGMVLHVSRICGYGAAGMFSHAVWLEAAVAAVALLGGNWLGLRLRPAASRIPAGWLEHGVLLTSVTIASVGALF